jgi:hypothetical protein
LEPGDENFVVDILQTVIKKPLQEIAMATEEVEIFETSAEDIRLRVIEGQDADESQEGGWHLMAERSSSPTLRCRLPRPLSLSSGLLAERPMRL